jgi:D-tyrosyl-tRNA(Tyr) deacylase
MSRMRIVLQRVKEACVIVEGRSTGSIQHGLLLLVGFREDDQEEQIRPMAEKIVNLRIFEDEAGKMNGSLLDVKGSILSVSQFTLYGDSRSGKVTIDLDNDTIEVEKVEKFDPYQTILDAMGIITPERGKELLEEVKKAREEDWK